MLKGIPSILPPELLKILMEMGHGDEIVIADGNFPGASLAQRLVRCDGHGVPAVLDAVLMLMPEQVAKFSDTLRSQLDALPTIAPAITPNP